MLKINIILSVALVLVLAACGEEPRGSEPPEDPESPSTTESTQPPDLTTLPPKGSPTPSLPSPTAEQPSNTVAEAEEASRGLLMEMKDVPDDAIQTVVAESVVWNDGSLGCPQPGRSYTQSLVPGFRVELLADEIEYAFHGAEGGHMMHCPNPSQGFNPDT